MYTRHDTATGLWQYFGTWLVSFSYTASPLQSNLYGCKIERYLHISITRIQIQIVSSRHKFTTLKQTNVEQ